MTAKLSPSVREQVLADLRVREMFGLKAIGRRHGVSRQTLARLRAELLRTRTLGQVDSRVISPENLTALEIVESNRPVDNPTMIETQHQAAPDAQQELAASLSQLWGAYREQKQLLAEFRNLFFLNASALDEARAEHRELIALRAQVAQAAMMQRDDGERIN